MNSALSPRFRADLEHILDAWQEADRTPLTQRSIDHPPVSIPIGPLWGAEDARPVSPAEARRVYGALILCIVLFIGGLLVAWALGWAR